MKMKTGKAYDWMSFANFPDPPTSLSLVMISKKTKYGLKALSYLARQSPGKPVQIATISGEEQIPRKFLESILLTLRKTGYLGSKKGKGGGYYLLKPPEEIVLAEVFRILEGPIALIPCVSLNFYEACTDCPDEERCSVHRLMIRVRDSTLEVLTNRTLKDITSESGETHPDRPT
jgi:Rrf2 family protein